MDDFSVADNKFEKNKGATFRVKELDEKNKTKRSMSMKPADGKARTHTLRQISLARAGLDVYDTDSISLWKIMTEHTPGMDLCFLVLGTFAAIIFGACFPAFFVFFGYLIDEMGLSTSEFNY